MNTKTQELVTAGYAMAKGLDTESAKLVKELADELAVQRVRADELNKQVVNLAVENAGLICGCGFFAYDPDNGFEEFKTKDEAIEAAESYIDYYRGDACDGWADEVSQVSWGVVMQQSTKVDERPKNAEDSVSDYIETVCDFALLPAIITPTTDAAIANIQAQGVDKLATFAGKEYQRFVGDKPTQRKWKGIVLLCTDFVSQLRKEPAA